MDEKKNRELTNEEKQMVLKDTQKYTDELETLEKLHDSMENKEKATNESESEKYDIEEKRNTVKERKKGREINRKLGYHRRYLSSQVKISNIVLIVLFIILSLLVIGKYAIPQKTLTSNSNISAYTQSKFGQKLELMTETEWIENSLKVKVTFTNNEKINVKFNPETIKLVKGDTIITPALSDKDKEAVSIEGVKPGETVTFSLKYNIDKGSTSNSRLETIVVGDGNTCIIVTSL